VSDSLMKTCNVCGEEKSLTEFYTNGKTKGGEFKYRPDCKECSKESKRVPEHLKKNKPIADINDPVFIKCRRMAADAHARVFAPSRQHKKAYRNLTDPFGFTSTRQMYEFLYIEFYDEVKTLIDAGLSPSVDRIDSSKGYTKENIRILEFTENTLLGVERRKRPIKVAYPDGNSKVFESAEACAREFNTNSSHIRGWINGKYKPKNKCFFDYVS
jgi:hypothetical protein